MSAIPFLDRVRPRPYGQAWMEAAFVVAGLGAMVVMRLAATRAGLDPVGIGAVFGLALLSLVAASRRRLELGPRPFGAALLGGTIGLTLVVVAAAGAENAGSPMVPGLGRPAAAFVPWAAVTLVVAVAEEAVLRGILFSCLRRAGGTTLAVLLTTALFALMHVPLYGWHVVPLDLAVGLVLGGLRAVSGGVVAPAAAHAVADLATWWR